MIEEIWISCRRIGGFRSAREDGSRKRSVEKKGEGGERQAHELSSSGGIIWILGGESSISNRIDRIRNNSNLNKNLYNIYNNN